MENLVRKLVNPDATQLLVVATRLTEVMVGTRMPWLFVP